MDNEIKKVADIASEIIDSYGIPSVKHVHINSERYNRITLYRSETIENRRPSLFSVATEKPLIEVRFISKDYSLTLDRIIHYKSIDLLKWINDVKEEIRKERRKNDNN